jgi:hypothetical protein
MDVIVPKKNLGLSIFDAPSLLEPPPQPVATKSGNNANKTQNREPLPITPTTNASLARLSRSTLAQAWFNQSGALQSIESSYSNVVRLVNQGVKKSFLVLLDSADEAEETGP